jgi:hypothetical protein
MLPAEVEVTHFYGTSTDIFWLKLQSVDYKNDVVDPDPTFEVLNV